MRINGIHQKESTQLQLFLAIPLIEWYNYYRGDSMDFKIKEVRSEYKITQQELSDLTEIPKRTIENWESGKRKPSPWVEKLLESYLKQYPVNERGIITERKNTYNIEQIKELLLSLVNTYDIKLITLFGSYAKGTADPLSDIDIAIDGNIQGLSFFGLLEDINQLFVKDVDLIHLKEVDVNSSTMDDIKKGIKLYVRT